MAFYNGTGYVWTCSRLGQFDRLGSCWHFDYHGFMLTSLRSQKWLFRGNKFNAVTNCCFFVFLWTDLTGVLLDSLALRSFLDSCDSPWPQFLVLVYRTRNHFWDWGNLSTSTSFDWQRSHLHQFCLASTISRYSPSHSKAGEFSFQSWRLCVRKDSHDHFKRMASVYNQQCSGTSRYTRVHTLLTVIVSIEPRIWFLANSLLIKLDVMWLHIRCAGGWTNKLYEYFEREQAKLCLKQSAQNQYNGGEPACRHCERILQNNASFPAQNIIRQMTFNYFSNVGKHLIP